jgi:hypothetical protein
MRRIGVFVAILCSLIVTSLTSALAQDATPTTDPALAKYPDFEVTITDSSFDVSTNQVSAGYVLLTVTNSTSTATSAGILGPGAGQTMDDLTQAAATPAAGEDFPPFLYEATVLGGPGDVDPGQSAQILVNIPAGDWAVFGEGDQPPTFFSAVEDADSNTTAPDADFTLELGDFYFAGPSEGVPSGSAIWEVTNTGKQPHMVVLAKVPDGTTEQQVLDTFTAEQSGTPVPGALDPNQAQFSSTGVLLLSSGETMYLPTSFDAGTYVALCFVTDPATGQPHVMEGMVSVFQIGEGTATPTT